MKIEAINIMPTEPVYRNLAGGKSRAITQETAPEVTAKVTELHREENIPHQENRDNAKDLEKSVKEINAQLESLNRSIQFNIDDKTKDVVVKIVDKDSGEIIRQIPPEGVLRLRERLEDLTGLIVEEKV